MPVSTGVLRTHIDYTAWASLRLLRAAASLTPAELTHDFHTVGRSILGALAHLYGWDRLWLSRLADGSHPGYVTEADRSLDALQTGWPALLERWQAWAADLTDERVLAQIAYSDRKGRPWKEPLCQLILHAVNHGLRFPAKPEPPAASH